MYALLAENNLISFQPLPDLYLDTYSGNNVCRKFTMNSDAGVQRDVCLDCCESAQAPMFGFNSGD